MRVCEGLGSSTGCDLKASRGRDVSEATWEARSRDRGEYNEKMSPGCHGLIGVVVGPVRSIKDEDGLFPSQIVGWWLGGSSEDHGRRNGGL